MAYVRPGSPLSHAESLVDSLSFVCLFSLSLVAFSRRFLVPNSPIATDHYAFAVHLNASESIHSLTPASPTRLCSLLRLCHVSVLAACL